MKSKRNTLFIVFLLLAACEMASDQTSAPSNGGGPETVAKIYMVGRSMPSSSNSVAGYWLNDEWNGLTSADPSFFCYATTLAVSGGDVHVGGYCTKNTVAEPQHWLNGAPSTLPRIDATKSARVLGMVIAGGQVYLGGFATDSDGVQVPGYWLNGTWNPLPALDATKNSAVKAIAASGSNVYFVGMSTNSSGVKVAGYWLNGAWTALPAIDNTKNSEANRVFISGSDVYIAGYSNASGVKIAGYWLNGGWNALPSIDPSKDSEAHSVRVVDGTVYASGGSYNAQGYGRAVYWKDGTLIELPALSNQACTAHSVAKTGDDIYAAGYCATSIIDISPGYWLNGVWTALSELDASKISEVLDMVIVTE